MIRVTEAGDLAKRVAGGLFLVVPFMPLRLLFDDPPGSSGLPGPGEWMLGLLVCAGVAWLASRRFPRAVERSADALAGVLRFPPFPAFPLAVLAALAALLTATSLAAFSRRPLLVDTIAQLFQAKIFAGGVAWVPASRTRRLLRDAAHGLRRGEVVRAVPTRAPGGAGARRVGRGAVAGPDSLLAPLRLARDRHRSAHLRRGGWTHDGCSVRPGAVLSGSWGQAT